MTHSHVTLADGSVIRARHVIDARGVGSAQNLARQTAYGVLLDAATAAPALNGRTAWFMDWKRDNGTSAHDAPSFLYAIPLDDRRVLLEETCLVGRPPLTLAELRARLETRLAARDVALPAQPTVERVRFVVEPPGRPQRGGALAYGARGGLIHPGTGYSVASALAHADPVAEALAVGAQPYDALWPRSARVVAILRRAGLHALLELDADHVDHFFGAFFAIPVDLQRAYLSSRTDSIRTLAAMWQVFRASPPGVRRAILRGIFHRNRRYHR